MNIFHRFNTPAAALLAAMILPLTAAADTFTPQPGVLYSGDGEELYRTGSLVQTQLRVNVDEKTNRLHVINTNNDPDIITKAYVLKHADPYEMRPYLRAAVSTERVPGGNKQSGGFAKVECLKYNDGTGVIIVSAEDYRFGPQQYGQSIDELVAALDMPRISSSSGQKTYTYFPKFWDSRSLSHIIYNVGMNHKDDPDELTGGKDKVVYDSQLNALFFYTPCYNVKNIQDMLELYDTPTYEVKVNYSVYEIDLENDGKLGADFQAWKNGPGADIFSTAGRFSRGWSQSVIDGFPNGTKWNSTKFIKFSPRWNTRYLDLLTAKSKAKILTSGAIAVMNATTAVVENDTSTPRFADGENFDDLNVGNEYWQLVNKNFFSDGVAADANSRGGYKLVAYDKQGRKITTTDFSGSVNLSKVDYGTVPFYEIRIGDITAGDGMIVQDSGKTGKHDTKCYKLKVYECKRYQDTVGIDPLTGGVVKDTSYKWVAVSDWNDNTAMVVQRDVERNTVNQRYGFIMELTPTVCEETTTLDIYLRNTSLVGFSDEGHARTTDSEVETQVMISNRGQRFIIGGVEKRQLTRGVSKVPWLGSLPLVGWALGSESESTKKTQLVTVLDCALSNPDSKVDNKLTRRANEVKRINREAGSQDSWKHTNFGFDQFHFDFEKNERGLDPAP